jgi:hypothetical protein
LALIILFNNFHKEKRRYQSLNGAFSTLK